MSDSTHSRSSLLAVSVTVAGRPWRRVDRFHSETADAGVFALRVDGAGAASVIFGDGVHGRRPPAGAVIQIAYRTGGGRDGQIRREAPLIVGAHGMLVPLPIEPIEVSRHEVRRHWPPW